MNIPNIVSYVVYGYIYLTVYYWVSFKNRNDFQNFIFKSLVVNYVLMSVYELSVFKIAWLNNHIYVQTVMLVTISAMLGLLLGRMIISHWFNFILHKFHVGRTTNDNIWDDVIKPYVWLCIYTKDGCSYLGQYRYGEAFKSEPVIMLVHYTKYDVNDEIVLDYSNEPERAVLLNTKDFEKIEIIYDEKNSGQNNQTSDIENVVTEQTVDK